MAIRSVAKIDDFVPVKHAFISVYNKEQVGQLAEQLFDICPGLTVFSSGGTYGYLKSYFIDSPRLRQLVEVSEYTRQPETEGGLVKTLHHKLFLGYLTETYCEEHQHDLAREGAVPIDLVIVDLYPFEEVIKKKGSTIEDCRGNIDIGGPAALRAAAKNYLRVMTVPKCTPEAYDSLIAQINAGRGHTNLVMRRKGAAETFKVTTAYDAQIADFFEGFSYGDLEKTYEIAEKK